MKISSMICMESVGVTMRIILPKVLYEIEPENGPVFFLAGPVRGGGDWQTDCCYMIQRHMSSFHAVLPCRYPASHPLMAFRQSGVETRFDRQLTWERHYLDLAATSGCLLFWLPCESATDPHPGPEPYAMDTRGELGEWRGRLMHDPTLRIVVGGESRFPGLSQIQRNFTQALGYEFPIYESLSATVVAALLKVKGQTKI